MYISSIRSSAMFEWVHDLASDYLRVLHIGQTTILVFISSFVKWPYD